MQDCTQLQCANARPTTRLVVLSARMAEEADEAREFIRRALEVTGWKPYRLAKVAGIAPTTITRPLNDPDFKFVPKQATLNKIAEAAGLTAPTVTEASLAVEPVSQWLPVVGEVRAGNWAEVLSEEPVIEEHIAVHLPEYSRASLFALRVVGRSMDLKYPDGCVVIVAPAAEAGIRVGDDVVVRRYRDGLAETTLKEVTQNGAGYELTPRSSDSSFQSFPFPHDPFSQDGIEIIGVVLTHQPPPAKRRGPLVRFKD
jgi:SOS-response transcriptional repressor LexA